MGLPHVTVAVHAMDDAEAKYEGDFLVDTGASDSLVPASGLAKTKIRQAGKMSYE